MRKKFNKKESPRVPEHRHEILYNKKGRHPYKRGGKVIPIDSLHDDLELETFNEDYE